MKRIRTARNRSNRNGHVLVEFAVILPVFMTFLFAMLEFGHFFMVKNALSAIAQKAARAGAYDGSTTADAQAKASAAVEI